MDEHGILITNGNRSSKMKKCWMLWRAIPKGNDNFATKVISTKNVEKKCKRSKKEESNLLLFQVIN